MYVHTVVSQVSAHGCLNITHDFSPYGWLPGCLPRTLWYINKDEQTYTHVLTIIVKSLLESSHRMGNRSLACVWKVYHWDITIALPIDRQKTCRAQLVHVHIIGSNTPTRNHSHQFQTLLPQLDLQHRSSFWDLEGLETTDQSICSLIYSWLTLPLFTFFFNPCCIYLTPIYCRHFSAHNGQTYMYILILHCILDHRVGRLYK